MIDEENSVTDSRADGASAYRARWRNTEADAYLSGLAEQARTRLPELIQTVTAEILAQMPVYGGGLAVAAADLQRSVSTNLNTMIDALSDSERIDVARARDTGTRRARQGVPLPEVLRAFRIGFSGLWDVMLDIAAAAGESDVRTLIAAANAFWYLIDEYLEAVTEAYREATTELVRAQRQRRDALLEALFSGGVVTETAMWDVTEQLELPHDGVFAVVSAETGEFASSSLPGVERRLAELGMSSAWRLTPSYELGIVSLGSPERLAELASALTAQASSRIGVSPAFRGLENTPRALRLAHVAGASIPLGDAGAACFTDSPLSMLVAAAPEESVSIARRILQPILNLPATERDLLLDTLDTWIANGGSTKAAASQLYCHPNTVRYRLQRVQTELHLSLADPVGTAKLVVALRAWRLFGNLKPLPPAR